MISISIISRVTSKRLFKGGWSHFISKQARDAWWERLLAHNQSPPSFSDWIFPHHFFFFQNVAKTRVSRPWWPLDGGSKNWRINALEGIDNEEAAADWFKTDESGYLI